MGRALLCADGRSASKRIRFSNLFVVISLSPTSATGGKKNDKLLILQERNSQGLHYNEEKSGDPFNLLGGNPRFGLSWQCELQSLQKKLQIFLRFGIA